MSWSTAALGGRVANRIGRRGSALRTVVILLVVGAIGIVGFFGARWWWREQTLRPSTEDALLNAHVVSVRPQVAGYVSRIHVVENQAVKAGDVLFEIDPRPFQQALRQAQSDLTITQSEVASDPSTIAAAKATADAAVQELAASQARLAYQKVLYDDTKRLQTSGEATPKELAQVQAALDEATAAVAAAQSEVAKTKAELEADIKTIGDEASEAARITSGEAKVALDNLDLEWATVRAPADGYITQFDLREGQFVKVGETLFYLIESGEWWIDANYKETRLSRIQPGMQATFTVDMYPGKTFRGVVESIARGSAASFSLLPPENATGNWVKVTQRITVRIRTKDDQPDAPLRKGASVTVTVDTTAGTAGNS